MGQHKHKAPRICLFCGKRGDMSKEHVFSKWISKYLPDPALNHKVTSSDDSWLPEHMRRTPLNKTVAGATGSRTFKIVCRTCNNGWMSDMEQLIEPLLARGFEGGKIDLDVDQQSLLARWIEKTAMVRDEGSSMMPVSTDEQRRALMKSIGADPLTKVYLGTFQDAKGPLRWRHHPHSGGYRDDNGPDVRQDSVVIGPWIFHVFSSHLPEAIERFGVKLDNCTGDFLKQIWPIVDPIVHWPVKAMNYRQYFFMAELSRWEIGIRVANKLDSDVVLMTSEQWCTVSPTEVMRRLPYVGLV